jgi:hypothetical protein
MTQYLLSVHSVEGAEPPSAEAIDKMYASVEAFNAELQGAGAWVFAGGLEPHTTAVVVTARDGGTLTTDGPFAEGKEHIGGFWVIEASSRDSAVDWAARASAACLAPVEVRPFQPLPEA